MFKKKNVNISSLNSDVRTKNILSNIFFGFGYKILGVMVSLLLVPVTVGYLNTESYGIWITLLSILTWITFFDIGLGNGMRNKLSEALSKGDSEAAKTYVSTGYISITIITFIVFIVISICMPLVNWNVVFNTVVISNSILSNMIFVVIIFSLVNFILSLGNQVFYAYQEASLTGLTPIISNMLNLLFVYILKRYTSNNLIYLGISYGISLILSNIIVTIVFFKRHGEVIPSIRYFDKNKIKDIMGLGVKFFIIQIAALILFTTDNMVITQISGPSEVTPFNIAQRLFNTVVTAHTILITPLWSAYTEAYEKCDMFWIKSTFKKLNLLILVVVMGVVTITASFNFIIAIWIGKGITFPEYLVLVIAIYTIISVWNNTYAYFLNGTGYLKISLIISIVASIINIPISIFFAKYLGLGTVGVVLGTTLCLLPGAVFQPIQTYCILNNRGKKYKILYS